MSNGPPIKIGFNKEDGRLEIEIREDIVGSLQTDFTDTGGYRRVDYSFEPGESLTDFLGVDDDEGCRKIDIKLRG